MESFKAYTAKAINFARYWYARFKFKKRYSNVLRLNGFTNKPAEGEAEWLCKWRKLDPNITSLQYRIFSHYIGPNVNIVPEETSHFFVEPVLNSKPMAAYYSDKNMFDKILPPPIWQKLFYAK